MEQANEHKPQLIIERWASPTHAVVELTYSAGERSYVRQGEGYCVDEFFLVSSIVARGLEMGLFKDFNQSTLCTIDL